VDPAVVDGPDCSFCTDGRTGAQGWGCDMRETVSHVISMALSGCDPMQRVRTRQETTAEQNMRPSRVRQQAHFRHTPSCIAPDPRGDSSVSELQASTGRLKHLCSLIAGSIPDLVVIWSRSRTSQCSSSSFARALLERRGRASRHLRGQRCNCSHVPVPQSVHGAFISRLFHTERASCMRCASGL